MIIRQGTGTGDIENNHQKPDRLAQTRFYRWIRPALFPLGLALVILIPIIIGLTFYYFEWRNSIERNQVITRLQPYERALEASLHETDLLISNLATYIQVELEEQSKFNQQQFNLLADSVLRSNSAIQSIADIQNQNIRFLRSQTVGNWANVFTSDESLKSFNELVKNQNNKLIGPFLLKNGQTVIMLQKSICLQNSRCDQIGAIIDMQDLLANLPINPVSDGISTSIRIVGGESLWGDTRVFDSDPVIRSFELKAIRLDIGAVPLDGWGNLSIRSTIVFGVIEGLIGLLFLGIVYLIAIQRHRLETAVKKRTSELARMSKNYQILGKCNQALVRATNDDQLIDDVCKAIVELGLYQAAWVYLGIDHYPSGKHFIAYSRSGEQMCLQPGMDAGELLTREEWNQPDNKIIEAFDPIPFFIEKSAPENLLKPGCCQVLFLKDESTTLGYLAILADSKEDFSIDQQEILVQLSHDLAYGLVSLRTRLAHQHTEVELRRQHDLFRRMMETNPSGILVYNRSGMVTMVNQRAEELLGINKDQINTLGKETILNKIFQFYDSHYQPLKMEDLPAMSIMDNGRPVYDLRACFEFQGENRWAIVNGAPINGENEVEGAIISLVDITDQREAEQALIESEKRYRRLFEGVQEGVWMIDPEGRTTFVNDNMAQMIGYTQAEMIGRSLFDYMDVHSQDFFRISLKRIKQGDQEKNDIDLLHKNGRHIYTRVETSPLFDEQGGVLGAMAMVSDITVRHQRELELEAIAKMAKALRNVAARKEIIPVILQQMQPLVNGDGACLLSRDVETGELMVEGSLGLWSSLAGIRLPFGEVVSQQVMESGQPYINADVQLDGSFDRPDLVGDLRTVFCVPLVTHDKIAAMLWVGRLVEENKPTTEPMPEELRLLLAAADIAASALYRATLHDQTDLRLQRLITLRNISLNISSTLDLEKILEALVGSVNSPAFISAAAILKYIPEERKLGFAAGCGFLRPPSLGARVNIEDDYSGYIVRNRRFFHLPNLQEVLHGFDRPWVSTLSEYQCYEAVPLIAKNQIKGVLELFFDSSFRVNNEWVDFIHAVSTEVAIAIDNLELLERLQQSNRDLVQAYDATIEGWSRALDLRDQETEGHARRVVDLTLRLAEEVGIPTDQLAHIRRGALLHDIGKMAIPDSILFKTGPLSLEEQDVMRNHPVYAYKLLSPIDYLRPALDIPYSHHEHWDGSGYPRHLSGEDIPLAARIFTIVDVWDALCSNRSYRAAWSDKKVRNYIKGQSGKILDPGIVKIFFEKVMGEPIHGDDTP